jgi:phosphoglycolate phosphatase-like HAD superfamily hydrolase
MYDDNDGRSASVTEQQKEASQAQGGAWAGGALPTHAGLMDIQEYLHTQPPLIVFDLDGTLLDSAEMAVRCHIRVLAEMGLPPVSRDVLDSLNGPSVEEKCVMLGLPPERQDEMEAALVRAEAVLVPTQARLFPGVPDMLAALHGRAVLCLLTNGQPSYLRMVCEVTGIGAWFAEQAGYTRGITKAGRIRAWTEAHAAPRVLMVGDRPTDVASAHEAGALALGVTYGNGRPEQMHEADALAGDIGAVLRYCEQFCVG